MLRPLSRLQALRRLLNSEIWRASELESTTLRGRLHRFLRVFILCFEGIFRNKLFSRAGSLSFSSLAGLAPLVAIAIPVGALFLGQDEDRAVRWLGQVVNYIAPHMAEYEKRVVQERTASTPLAPGETAALEAGLNPQLIDILNGIIKNSRNGALGVVGALMLVVVVIQLFTAVETTFNEIWGAKRGRTWLSRIVIYWTVLTLGSILAIAALSLVSLAASARLDWLPFGEQALAIIRLAATPAAAALLVGVLTVFYRATPATPVQWKAACAGAVVVTGLLILNHYSASLYVGRVMLEKNFYGQLGIVFVLMAGLYIFWLFILLGAQLSFAVQNANYLCRDPDWDNLSHRARESYTLLVFLQVARTFKACEPALSVSELARRTRLPNTIVHHALVRLQALDYIHFIEGDDTAEIQTHKAQPARPLDSISLGEFHDAFESLGVGRDDPSLYEVDPLLRAYRERIAASTQSLIAIETIDTLVKHAPLDGTRQSKALGNS